MKRAPLQRRTPLSRGKPINRKRARPRRVAPFITHADLHPHRTIAFDAARPPKRKAKLRTRRRTRAETRQKYSETMMVSGFRPDGIDLVYRRWIRSQPCCSPPYRDFPNGRACANKPSHAHHPRQYAPGLGMKAPDRYAIPLCGWCHQELHALSGAFRGWDRVVLQSWERDRIAEHRARYERAALRPQ